MTKIKSAIENLIIDDAISEETVELAIRSLKAWEEVLQELENMRDVIWQDIDDERRIVRASAWDKNEILVKVIDIINQHLSESEEK